MDKTQAVEILSQVAQQYKGTFQEHVGIQKALEVVSNELGLTQAPEEVEVPAPETPQETTETAA